MRRAKNGRFAKKRKKSTEAPAKSRKRPDRLITVLHAARSRAKQQTGVRAEYDLDEHLPALRARFASAVCEATGLPFDMKALRRRAWNSPSIDRIDSTKGYTINNVRFIVWSLNAALGPFGDKVFEIIATAWLYHRARKRP